MLSRRVSLTVAAVAALCLTSASSGQAPTRRFALDSREKQAVMAFFRSRLSVGLGAERADAPEWFSEPRRMEGVLSLYRNTAKHAQVVAEGNTPLELCEALVRAMGRELWQSGGGANAVEDGILKVDFVLQRARRPIRLDLPIQNESHIGTLGYIIHERENDQKTWFTPLDGLRVGRTGNLLHAMYREMGRNPPNRVRTEVFRSLTIAEKTPGGEAYRLYRTGPLLEDLSSEDLMPAFLKAVGWLMAIQDTSGRFALSYEPLTQRTGDSIFVPDRRRDADYPMALHLRAIEPLLRVYETMEDDRLLRSAELALRYARERVVTIDAPSRTELGEDEPEGPVEDICYVGEPHNLARATALMLASECLMAKAQRSGATGLMRRLGKTLVYLVDDQGFMGFTLRDLMRGDTPHSQDSDIPGRTVYALTLLHELDPREEWIAPATRIGLARLLPERSDRFERNPWDVIAMERLYRAQHADKKRYTVGEFIRSSSERVTAEELHERFFTGAYVHGAGLLASARRDRQWLADRAAGRPLNPRHETDLRLRYYWPGSSEQEDYIGGFIHPAGPPRVSDTAQRLRALAAVYSVALIRAPEDLTFHETIREIALPISRFLIRQQFRPENSFYVRDSALVEGAFRESPADFLVRMETTAEAICALMAALQVINIDHAEPRLD